MAMMEAAVDTKAMPMSETEEEADIPLPYDLTEDDLLKIAKDFDKDANDNRWVWERQWMRNIHYVNLRQWIVYDQRSNEWKDKRMAKHIPRPVSSKPKEGVQAIRAIFTAVKIGANVRPNGSDPKNVAVAAAADEMAPLLHEEHGMDDLETEADYWLIVTGNAFFHEFLDYDYKYGSVTIQNVTCAQCQMTYPEDEIAENQQMCPECGSMGPFEPAVKEDGSPDITQRPQGRGATVVLSPFELAFPNFYPRFSDVPGVRRNRWRSKEYYQNHPELKEQMVNASYQKSPSDRSMQIFKSLPNYNDMGVSPLQWSNSSSGGNGNQEEGLPEYEYWFRPSDRFPQGLVFRIAGDGQTRRLLRVENEGLPGPIPYTDIEGNALFPFQHEAFEQVGGRVYGSGPIDAVITKIDDLNKLDSMIQMIIQRMANPLWMIPKGSEIEKFTGAPGLVVKWNPLTVGGNAKPERIAGEGPHGSFFTIREMILKDIEDAMGTFDIIKGAKPAGVEAFAALQLLVERSQSRFGSAFQARGGAYRDWLKVSLEIERQFGPQKRIQAVLGPAREYTLQTFMNADLQGSFAVIVEDGSTTPKTNLGTRAAIEHLSQLGVLNVQDPDQAYQILVQFGQTKLIPSMDIHVQAALQKQQAFEEWAQNPQAVQQVGMALQGEFQNYAVAAQQAQPDPLTGQPVGIPPEPPVVNKGTPLKWYPWYKASIHKQEFLKWANSDRVRLLLKTQPGLEMFLTAHLQDIDNAATQEMLQAVGASAQLNVGVQKGKPNGAGTAMAGSNREAGDTSAVPKGNGEGAQNAGPR